MKYLNNNLLKIIALFVVILLSSCSEEDELAFDVFESPVLAEFDGQSFSSSSNISVTATFYDLDKSGILDQNVGIDSVEIPNLSVQVFVNETQEVANLTTDGSGKVTFDQPWSTVGGPGRVRLEWVGKYNDRAFRIYHIIDKLD